MHANSAYTRNNILFVSPLPRSQDLSIRVISELFLPPTIRNFAEVDIPKFSRNLLGVFLSSEIFSINKNHMNMQAIG